MTGKLARYADAFRALCENSLADYAAGVVWETPEYLRVNHEINEAIRGVSWWRRALIDRRVMRELDWQRRMRQVRKGK